MNLLSDRSSAARRFYYDSHGCDFNRTCHLSGPKLRQSTDVSYNYAKCLGAVFDDDNKILRVNMANIRRKPEKNPGQPEYIFTEIGVGYRMIEDGSSSVIQS